MGGTKEQVLTFLEKCDELKKCKFIMATTKIKDLLKCIVNSPELYRLFDSVTENFNYAEQKQRCLVTVDDGFFKRSRVVLPQTVGQRLAFIFCLLVEFDRDTLNFNDFLQKYFPEDGSYFASYRAFCGVIIVNLEELIKQVFKAKLEEDSVAEPNCEKSNLLSAVLISIEAEKDFIFNSEVQREEKENGLKILSALSCAVKDGNAELIEALICGYNYFILYNKCVGDNAEPLVETLAKYVQNL